ncbi:MAG: SagB/ThcOx family dehydrogenase [Actinomycetota bacterium]
MSDTGSGRIVTGLLAAALLLGGCGTTPPVVGSTAGPQPLGTLALPPPSLVGSWSLEEALAARRSVRQYAEADVAVVQLGQLLWAAQGITEEGGQGRTAPSAGGTYPLEVYAATAQGLYHYLPGRHALEVMGSEDLRPALSEAAGGQEWVRQAPLVVVLVGVVERTAARYGDRAERYVALEAGHAAQNLMLQAVVLGLGVVPVGAFDDDAVRRVVGLPDTWAPLYLIPVGHPVGE